MNTPQPPTHIITNHLGISTIVISHADSAVCLVGIYGSLLDGSISEIEIETDFETLYGLLDIAYDSGYGPRDQVIAAIARALTHPTGTFECIDLGENGYELSFYDHLFVFQALCMENEDGQMVVPEDLSYLLHGYIETGSLFPRWIDMKWPGGRKNKAKHYNRVLGLQYHLYLHFRKTCCKSRAVIMCGLTNPHAFSLARMQYGLDSISEGEN